MSQDEILKLLNDHPYHWFNSKEIAEILNITQNSINTNLKKLADNNFILRREFKTKPVTFEYISIFAPKRRVKVKYDYNPTKDIEEIEKKYGEGFICIQNGKIYREKD